MVNQPKIINTTPITITKVTSLAQSERVIANRNSAIALIANTNNSCPFKHSNQYYMCAYCQERYADFPSLHQHVGEVHSTINPTMIRKAFARTEKDQKIKINFMDLSCKLCEENFKNFKDLKIHLKNIHRKPVDIENDGVLPYKITNNDFECLLCGIVFQNYPALNKHINSHFPYFTCKHCGMGCATSQRLRQHITNHGERLHSCEICQKGFPTVSRKKEHVTRVHMKAKQNKCRLCPETFSKYYEKVNHMKNVHDNTSVGTFPIKPVDVAKQNENSPGIVKVIEKKKTSRESAIIIILSTNVCPFRFNGNFMCMYCQNQFVSMSDLLQHTNTIHQNIAEVDIKKAVSRISKQIPIKINISDSTCKICNHVLSDFDDLKHHLVGKHKKDIDLENDGLMAFKIAGEDYSCVRCGFQCDNYKLLNKHVNDKHFNTFICDQCGLGFATKSGLQCHAMSHVSGSYPCEICGRVYRTAWSKRHHVKIDHLNIKLNKCTHCSETFKGYYQKLKHIAEVHGVRRYNYKCSFCLKSFLSNSNLRNHERTVHAQGHKYVCDNCNYHTYDKHLLKLHMICHSDEKNHKCQVCEKSYARKKTLTEHMKIHNNIRRFVCQYCDRAFVQKCSLKGHLKTHHRDAQSAECDEDLNEETTNDANLIVKTSRIRIVKVTSLAGRLKNRMHSKQPIAPVVGRESAIALIANTERSCPFKYNHRLAMCVFCPEKYTEFDNLYRHVNDVHQTVTETMVRRAFSKMEKDQKIKVNFVDLVCKICDGTFNAFNDLKAHLKESHGKPVEVDNDGVLAYKIMKDVYDCLLCGANLQNYMLLNKHVHSHYATFVCNQCDLKCSNLQRLRIHMADHAQHMHFCVICRKTFPSSSRTKDHINKIHLKKDSNTCPICLETFAGVNLKIVHFKEVHGQTCVGTLDKPPVVEKALLFRKAMVKNPKLRTSRDSAITVILNTNVCPFKYKNQFMCMYCQNQYITMQDLIEHTRSEHCNITEFDIRNSLTKLAKFVPIKINVTDFTCKLCNCESIDFNDLKHHLVRMHKKQIDLQNDGLMAYRITNDGYVCIVCGLQCESYKELNKHINDEHFSTFICEQCGMGFATSTRLQAHSVSHSSGTYPCEFCDKVYRTIWSRRQHIKITHLNKKLNKCTHCSETFKDYYQKLKHLVTVHGVRRYNYICKLCGKSFLTNSRLWSHKRTAHPKSGAKYECDQCDYVAHSKAMIGSHMICHSNEKNYKCEVCMKRYARKKTLTEHMKIHNNIRNFVCAYCGKAFVQKCSLKGHMKTNHRDFIRAEY